VFFEGTLSDLISELGFDSALNSAALFLAISRGFLSIRRGLTEANRGPQGEASDQESI
jgi:hypothetical protein